MNRPRARAPKAAPGPAQPTPPSSHTPGRADEPAVDVVSDVSVPDGLSPGATQARAETGHETSQAGSADDLEAIRFNDVVSGQFDEDDDVADTAQTPDLKRVLAPQPDAPKLHKVLAQAGLGSRLEMEQLIMEGRISVNNEPAHVGQRIQYGDQIRVNGKPIQVRIAPPPVRVIAYHKPVGEVVTHDDPQNRPTVFRKLPRLYQGKWQSVGRLDINTEGLLLFTSSGELANQLMHPRFGLEREYAVRVLGALSNEEKQRLRDGVTLDDGPAHFTTLEDGGGEGSNCWYRVTIHEGRNREVRRLFEAVGHAVSRLIRIRYGAMVLPRGLKRGHWMELGERDIAQLMQAAGMTARPVMPAGSGGRGAAGKPAGSRQRRADRAGQGPRGAFDGTPKDKRQNTRTGAQQPDPMKTSLGYIGADGFRRNAAGGRPGGSGGGARRGGSSGGFGGPGGGSRRGGRGR